MAWECLSDNYSQTEIISAQRGIINNDILLIVQQCISAYGTYIGIYRPLGKVLNMDLITMVRDGNVQLVKLFLKAHSFFPISTCVGKMDLYGKFMPYTNISVKEMRGVSVRIHYQDEYIKTTKLVASTKSIVLC